MRERERAGKRGGRAFFFFFFVVSIQPPTPPPLSLFRINGALTDGDLPALRACVSPGLYAGLAGVRDAYAAAGLSFSLAVDARTLHARIDDMALLSDAALAAEGGMELQGDDSSSSRADSDGGDAPASSTSSRLAGLHQVLAVRFSGAVAVAVRRGGDVVSELTDRRSKVWRFVRGPLPAGLPVRRLDGVPWTLLAID